MIHLHYHSLNSSVHNILDLQIVWNKLDSTWNEYCMDQRFKYMAMNRQSILIQKRERFQYHSDMNRIDRRYRNESIWSLVNQMRDKSYFNCCHFQRTGQSGSKWMISIEFVRSEILSDDLQCISISVPSHQLTALRSAVISFTYSRLCLVHGNCRCV